VRLKDSIIRDPSPAKKDPRASCRSLLYVISLNAIKTLLPNMLQRCSADVTGLSSKRMQSIINKSNNLRLAPTKQVDQRSNVEHVHNYESALAQLAGMKHYSRLWASNVTHVSSERAVENRALLVGPNLEASNSTDRSTWKHFCSEIEQAITEYLR
jgi:hypothetical protein